MPELKARRVEEGAGGERSGEVVRLYAEILHLGKKAAGCEAQFVNELCALRARIHELGERLDIKVRKADVNFLNPMGYALEAEEIFDCSVIAGDH